MSSYAVVNPATGDKVKEYPEASDADLSAAIAAAEKAHAEWSQTSSVADRAGLIQKVADFHGERREELAAIAVKEMGKPMEQALGEVDFCVDIYGYYADNAEKFLADEPIDLLAGEGSALIRRTSMGPLIGIMPWNFPYYQVARFAGPNLIVGNTILLKPAPQCPESAEAMQKMYDDAGFPEGAYQTILASNDQIAEIIADPRIRGVSLTGSERAGAAVAEIAGRNLKKVVLELGGSDPFILLKTGDLDEAVQAAIDARLDNTGQSCNAAKRFIVADDLYDDFLEKFSAKMKEAEPGDPTADDTEIGPLSSATAAERLQDQLDRAVKGGAEVVVGGRAEGQLLPDHRADRDHARQRRLPRGVLRARRGRLQGRLRGGGDRACERHAVRPGLLCLHGRLRAGDARREQPRHGDGVRERRRPGRGGAAIRRRQALRLRPGAGPLRHGRVRQQEADPGRQVSAWGFWISPAAISSNAASLGRPASEASSRYTRALQRDAVHLTPTSLGVPAVVPKGENPCDLSLLEMA